jgi:MFS family permease
VRSPAAAPDGAAAGGTLPRPLVALLAAVTLFTLGNSADVFLLLRATDLGVPVAQVPLLWALLHVVKSASSTPGGALSDRVGRRPLIAAGWLVYAAVYLGFAAAGAAWHAWALFAVYGLVFGLVEGAEKALVADLAPAARRGASSAGTTPRWARRRCRRRCSSAWCGSAGGRRRRSASARRSPAPRSRCCSSACRGSAPPAR